MSDPVEPEPQTGPLEGRCGAVRAKDAEGRPVRWCRKYPMRGQTRCERDGGKAPQNLAAAERRRQAEQAQQVLRRYGVPVEVEWHQALQEGLDETYGNVLALRDLIQRMEPDALCWGTAEVVEVGASRFPGTDVTRAARVSPLVELYERERDRLHRMAVDAGKLGLEVRRQQIAERVGAEFADAMSSVLRDFHQLLIAGALTSLDPADPQVMRVVSSRLQQLAGAA